jgi:ferredoxin
MLRSVSLLLLLVPTLSLVPQKASVKRNSSHLFSSSTSSTSLISLTLEKPLGLILEEVEEGAPKGVKVQELSDSGSAYASEYKDQLVGLKVATVMGEDVTTIGFDDAMQKIVDAPSPVSIQFFVEGVANIEEVSPPIDSQPQFDVGTVVTINVIQEGKPDLAIQAKVGNNLRRTLLDNDVEVYRGLKKKLGNCGGAGQCTFCAVDFVESEGWEPRSEYEESKIAKWPTARLACLNNIQGPATIRVQ